MAEYPNGQVIWDYLVSKLGNEYGAAGMMGNLYWESGLIPYRKEGDFSVGYVASLEYTEGVDDGTITENTFVYDAVGYGLAQWTYYSRKQELYNRKQQRGVSIGHLGLGLDYLWWELNNLSEFQIVLTTLQSAQSIREASDIVLTRFENPINQSEAVKQQRENTSIDIYNTYHGSGGGDIPPTIRSKRKHLNSAQRFLIMRTMLNRR